MMRRLGRTFASLVLAALGMSGTVTNAWSGGLADHRLVVAMQQRPPAATDEFVPIDQLPPEERLPAAPLLIAAYGFVWLALFGYLVMMWRRLEKVERELSGVARRVEAMRRE